MRLRRENRQLKIEREILSRATACSPAEATRRSRRLRAREREPSDPSVHTMFRVLYVSCSGFYARQARAPSRHAIEDAVLTDRIRLLHDASDEIYGSPNIHAELRDEGTRVGRNFVARLMRKTGLRGVSRRRGFIVTTRRDPSQRPVPDLVNRAFTARAPEPA